MWLARDRPGDLNLTERHSLISASGSLQRDDFSHTAAHCWHTLARNPMILFLRRVSPSLAHLTLTHSHFLALSMTTVYLYPCLPLRLSIRCQGPWHRGRPPKLLLKAWSLPEWHAEVSEKYLNVQQLYLAEHQRSIIRNLCHSATVTVPESDSRRIVKRRGDEET